MPLASVQTEQYIGQSCTALCRPFQFHVHPFLSSRSLCHLQHEEAAAAALVFNTCPPQLSTRLNLSFLLVTWVDLMLSEPWPEMNQQCSQSPAGRWLCRDVLFKSVLGDQNELEAVSWISLSSDMATGPF